MNIDKTTIEAIATLAKLGLTEEEKVMYARQLSTVFDFVAMLDEVDTEGVEETCQVTGLQDVFREDVVEEIDEETRQKLVGQFPDAQRGMLKVHAVFNGGEE